MGRVGSDPPWRPVTCRVVSQFFRLMTGQAFQRLRDLPDNSVSCVVTSPPYFRQRDYGVDGQIGLEDNPVLFLERVMTVMGEVNRVLHPKGTVWVNLGDSYADRANIRLGESDTRHLMRRESGRAPSKVNTIGGEWNLKRGDRMMIPARFAIAMQESGWWLRQEVIWHNPTRPPEGTIYNRPHHGHEMVYMFAKRCPGYYYDEVVGRQNPDDDRDPQEGYGHALRSVWTIPSEPYHGKHAAPFPTTLAEMCVQVGTSEAGVCTACGAPHVRDLKRTPIDADGNVIDKQAIKDSGERVYAERTLLETLGWVPDCHCDASTSPAVVLDPFCGASTVGLAALRNERSYVGIDLSPASLQEGRERLHRHLGNDAALLERTDHGATHAA